MEKKEKVTSYIKEKKDIYMSKMKNDRNFLKLFISVVLFIFLTISFLRIPYIGEFFDSVFLSFIFGWSKYIIYIYLFTLIILFWLKKLKKPLYSKRAILLLFITTFLFCSLLAAIFSYVENPDRDSTNSIIPNYAEYWREAVFPLHGPSHEGFNPFYFKGLVVIDGGFIGACISFLSNVIIIILSIIGIIAVYLSLANKHREKIFTFFKRKVLKKNVAEEVIVKNEEQQTDEKVNYIVDNKYLDSILQDSKKEYLNLDGNIKNKGLNIEILREKILEFFTKNNLSFMKSSINETDEYYEINFLIDDETYNNFNLIKGDFKTFIGQFEFTTEYDNNNLTFKFIRSHKFENELLKRNLLIKYENPFDIAFLNLNNYPLVLNLRKNNFIGVFDSKDNNIDNLINNIIYSLSWTYKVNQLKVYYLSTRSIKLNSFSSPNFNSVEINTTKDAISFLKKLNKEIKELLKEFKKKNVYDIYSYNSLIGKTIENRVIIINDFNQMININPDIYNHINEINANSLRCGITIITFDKSIDAISYNSLKYNISLIFKSTVDVSRKILGNSSAANLDELDEAILFNASSGKTLEVKVPHIIPSEDKKISSELIKCYKNKEI